MDQGAGKNLCMSASFYGCHLFCVEQAACRAKFKAYLTENNSLLQLPETLLLCWHQRFLQRKWQALFCALPRSLLTSLWMHICSREPSTAIFGLWNIIHQIDYEPSEVIRSVNLQMQLQKTFPALSTMEFMRNYLTADSPTKLALK